MDFQDWLIVAGAVIIVGILLDGFRRMHLAKKDSISMSRNMMGNLDLPEEGDDFNPELPGGGARVVSRGDGSDQDAVSLSDVEDETKEKVRLEPSFVSDEPVSAEKGVVDDGEFALVADAQDRPVTNNSASDSSGSVSAPTKKTAKEKSTESASQSPEDVAPAGDQEVIVINVDAKTDTEFSGVDIKALLEACGLDHGDMSIFHRHEEDDLLSPIQFSVANAVEPGYFDPSNMEELSTPGVSFFMSLPGPKDYMKAFEYMLETAQCFASNLQGELKDERRSVLTPQTIEHCKQRVREFERKQLSRVRA